MSDLKERLRKGWIVGMVSHHEALERIEALEAEKAEAYQHGYDAAKEQAAAWNDAQASLYSAYADRDKQKGDLISEAEMRGHATTHTDSARAMRAMTEAANG